MIYADTEVFQCTYEQNVFSSVSFCFLLCFLQRLQPWDVSQALNCKREHKECRMFLEQSQLRADGFIKFSLGARRAVAAFGRKLARATAFILPSQVCGRQQEYLCNNFMESNWSMYLQKLDAGEWCLFCKRIGTNQNKRLNISALDFLHMF